MRRRWVHRLVTRCAGCRRNSGSGIPVVVASAGQAGDGGPQSIVERDLGHEADLVAEPADVGDEALWLAGTCRARVQVDELRTAQQMPKPDRNSGDRRGRSGADVDGAADLAVEPGRECRGPIPD